MKKTDLNYQELRMLLKSQNVTIRPAYKHKDYIFTSFTMPYALKLKLDRMQRKHEISRSKIVQMLISMADEESLLRDYFGTLE